MNSTKINFKNKINEETIQFLCNLYKKEKALRKVSRITGFSPRTIDRHISSRIKVKRQNIIRILKKRDDILIGTYIGLFAGDGTRYYDRGYKIKICYDKNNSKETAFLKKLYHDLFGKKVFFCNDGGNRGSIKTSSKFIYKFIDEYLIHEKNKTLTVRLRKKVECYSNKFLRGFLLGLMLSDGCMKNKFVFTTISDKLAKNVEGILNIFGYKPHHYVQKNRNWRDVHRITLTKNESCNMLKFLDNALTECDSRNDFSQLKYGPTAI